MRVPLIFILLISLNSQLNSQNPDIEILRAINSPEELPSDDFFRFISNSEPYIMFAVPAGMATAGYFKNDKTLIRNACTGLAAIAINGGITLILKYSVNRDRPFVTYPDIIQKSKVNSPSFPSGALPPSSSTISVPPPTMSGGLPSRPSENPLPGSFSVSCSSPGPSAPSTSKAR